MQTHLNSIFEPYKLNSDKLFFTDWRWISPGTFNWEDEKGVPVNLWPQENIPQVYYQEYNMPVGIGIKSQPATKIGAILSCDKPWEDHFGCVTILYDSGKYRMWYSCLPRSAMNRAEPWRYYILCYAESDDGLHWVKPQLGIIELQFRQWGGDLTTPRY